MAICKLESHKVDTLLAHRKGTFPSGRRQKKNYRSLKKICLTSSAVRTNTGQTPTIILLKSLRLA